LFAKVFKDHAQVFPNLIVYRPGYANPIFWGQGFQPGSDVYPIPGYIITIDDDVPNV
jgi:hypothetical protein